MKLYDLPTELLQEIFSFLFNLRESKKTLYNSLIEARQSLQQICQMQQVCTTFRSSEEIIELFNDLMWSLFCKSFPSALIENLVELCGDEFEEEILEPIRKKHLMRKYITGLMRKIGKLSSSSDNLKVLFLGKY
ncbi:hypothetical protein NAEGRDRAFT_62941 [Naegleria gruberi]|uniref:F-box domain-containing protein n=1 Tax=Naegleria gruberi TaxID=5762 RepID=D2V2B2_NAEGR|nr:uncharacterized protein NAEGRDRAFT_62941 [Naegleria gruberi]EFC48870.1 hypothetical protein NAEGRDRAFT_62941 [Naegleria gruberi]|eukprot:XP_002681614.1 hypothetical protein NAEGRDRAFT_62941 [Naegleria gruberi strain NEG-M]